MHLDLKEDALVDQVKVLNANKANGYLNERKGTAGLCRRHDER